MARGAKVLCDFCESRITPGVSFCGHCGTPTRWASHEERTSWEVSQWKTADRSISTRGPAQGRDTRRWPFGRKSAPPPVLALVEAPPAGVMRPPAPTSPSRSSVPSTPKPSPLPMRAPAKSDMRPASRSAPAVRPTPRDDDAVVDTPAAILALRLLNAKVEELEMRLRDVEAEVAERSSESRGVGG